MRDPNRMQARTIADFGDQWQQFDDIDTDWYGRDALFDDILVPFVRREDIEGTAVADIGSGTGRIVRMLAEARPARLIAVEPSAAFDVLVRNTRSIAAGIEYLNGPGEALPGDESLDWVFSIGVIHHIPDPDPTVQAAFAALKPGGRLCVWLYGVEGNGIYLALARPARSLTTRLPAPLKRILAWCLWPPLAAYIQLCRVLPLPLHRYARRHLARLTRRQLVATIHDQLSPAWAKYYTRQQAVDLLTRNAFVDVRAHHRHGYSWTVIGSKPHSPSQ
jgi:SAM-dependent methyltransferase